MADVIAVSIQRPHAPTSPVSVRAMALPAEHGGWGLLAEPLLLGLLVAPSAGGVAVACALAGAFLFRHPARLAFSDWRKGVRYPRTRIGGALAAGYAVASLAGLAVALALARGPLELVIAAAAPFAGVYLAEDFRLRGREAGAQLSGALAMSAGAPAVAIAAGWPLVVALGLWLLVAGRAVGSVLDVRCRLRRQYGKPSSAWPVFLTHGVVGLAAVAAASAGAVPVAAATVPFALLGRSAWNLRSGAPRVRPQGVGWSEVRVGAIAVLVWLACYRLTA